MKTKEQVLEHLANNSYAPYATGTIMGFLVGSGIIEKEEAVTFRKGNLLFDKKGNLLFDDFYEWFNEEEIEVIEARGSYIDVVKKDGETSVTFLCLSNIVDNKVLVYNGTGVVVCDLKGLKWDISSDKNMEEFMLKMADAGFCYLESSGFFLLDELEIEECEE